MEFDNFLWSGAELFSSSSWFCLGLFSVLVFFMTACPDQLTPVSAKSGPLKSTIGQICGVLSFSLGQTPLVAFLFYFSLCLVRARRLDSNYTSIWSSSNLLILPHCFQTPNYTSIQKTEVVSILRNMAAVRRLLSSRLQCYNNRTSEPIIPLSHPSFPPPSPSGGGWSRVPNSAHSSSSSSSSWAFMNGWRSRVSADPQFPSQWSNSSASPPPSWATWSPALTSDLTSSTSSSQ